MRRRMHTDTEKRPSTPSAGPGRHTDTSSGPDTPQGAEAASGGKRRKTTVPRKVFGIGRNSALAIEVHGTHLAKAVAATEAAQRLPAAEREAEMQRQWHEIMLVLDEHAKAITAFIEGFCGAGCFRWLADAERERERSERRAAVADRLQEGGRK